MTKPRQAKPVYIGSIIYQIEEALPEAKALEVKQISESEGTVLKRMGALMFLLSAAAILYAAVGVSEMVVSVVNARSREIALMKALGAEDRSVAGVFLTETVILALLGGVIGYFLGGAAASVIGQRVFDVTLNWRPLVLPVSLFASLLVSLIGSIAPLKSLLKLDPARVLHR